MKVTIITVAYNSVDTISGTIESVINQTYQDIEYIIIDGKSNDGTLDIVNNYERKITKVISEEDNGIYDAMNKGISIASGDVIGFLNADDLFFSNQCIEKIMVNFNGEVDVVYGDLIYVDRDDSSSLIRYWKSGNFEKSNYKDGWMTPHPSTYIKKRVYDEYGIYDTRFRIAADYELMLRFLYKNNLKVKYVPEVIVKMRTGGVSNRSFRNIIVSNDEVVKSWRVNGLKVPLLIILKKPISKLKQFFRIFDEKGKR